MKLKELLPIIAEGSKIKLCCWETDGETIYYDGHDLAIESTYLDREVESVFALPYPLCGSNRPTSSTVYVAELVIELKEM